ncbi:MAG: NADH-quinone oxidoreductase subunit NuoE [candidate division Zixibacteria bacterium]|nr:NADH-quinone oxidoreductase subunit NuoE [candidate division Zixibacteria bacterium]MBU1471895.1 NADH-quinone oxidoreductase subunit NuoE [candidate division Zixibacteria bacterium]
MILTDESVKQIRLTIPHYPQRRSCILPALTIAYWQVGHLNDDLYREISDILELQLVDVAEAASFYTMFPKRPVGRYFIQVCQNISCSLLGADSLIEYLLEKLNVKLGDITKDGLFTVVTVECLGSCTTAPMMQVNDKYYEKLTRIKVDSIIEELRSKG